MRLGPEVGAMVAIALAGCAVAPAPSAPEPLYVLSASGYAPPPRDSAQVIFLAPAATPEPMQANAVFDLDGLHRTLLAALGAHAGSLQVVAPGRHLFMTWGRSAHLVAADLAPGGRYYVLLRPLGNGDLVPLPLRRREDVELSFAGPAFFEWVSDSPLVDMTPAARARFAADAPRIDAAQRAALAAWERLSAEERAAATLDSDDAVLR